MRMCQDTTPTNTSDCMSEGGNVLSDSDNDNVTTATMNAIAEKDSSGLSDVETERGSSMGGDKSLEEGTIAGRGDLPHLVVKGCTRSHIYLLSPFSSALLVDCQDCDIITGPVAGLVVVSGCIKSRITSVCRKLLVKSSCDCTFFLATLTPTLIQGDSRALVFGKAPPFCTYSVYDFLTCGVLQAPYNTCYRHLKVHLDLVELSVLHSIDSCDVNCWAVQCDLKSVLEVPGSIGSPSGYAMDALGGRGEGGCSGHSNSVLLPQPSEELACLLSPSSFRFVSIPYRAENKDYKVHKINELKFQFKYFM
jgi:hypothetical protein